MTTAGVVMMLIVPAVLAIAAGVLLAGDRWGFVPENVLARSRTPAKVLSYLAFGFVAFAVVSAVVAGITGRPEQQQPSALLWMSVSAGFWFSPYLLAGALLRKLASTTTAAPADDMAATERHDDAADESRLVRTLKVTGRAVLSLWLAAVSAWALGAALNVAGLDWNSQIDTAVLVLFGAVMTAVYFRGIKPRPN